MSSLTERKPRWPFGLFGGGVVVIAAVGAAIEAVLLFAVGALALLFSCLAPPAQLATHALLPHPRSQQIGWVTWSYSTKVPPRPFGESSTQPERVLSFRIPGPAPGLTCESAG